jgi:hypothetical protein
MGKQALFSGTGLIGAWREGFEDSLENFKVVFSVFSSERTENVHSTKHERRKEMSDFNSVLETVERRFKEEEPMDRYAQLNQFRFKVTEHDRPELIPFVADGQDSTGPLALKEHALRQLCSRIGVPYSFFNKCPPALQEFNVAWFMQNMEQEKDIMLRLVRGCQVRAIVSDRYAPFDDMELFQVLADFMDGTEEVQIQSFEELSSHVRITWPTTKEEVQPGDIVEQGLHIANSEVGVRSVTIIGVVHRLKCKNGLVAREKKGGFRHVGAPERIREQVKQVIEEVRHDTGALVEKFKMSLTKEIEYPMAVMDQISQDHDLTKDEYKSMLDSFMLEPSKNLFGVVNAITNSAQSSSSADRRFELESIAGQVLDRQLTA